MNLIKKWNEYLGPKDERLEAESNRIMKTGYIILIVVCILCIYYGLMTAQVADVTDTPLLTAAGKRVIPLYNPLIIFLLISGIVGLTQQARAGLVSERVRYAQVDHIPWDLVSWTALACGAIAGILTAGFRIIAEIQIVGLENVMWGGDIAVGIVFFGMAFVLGLVLGAAQFRDAIKHREQLERELEE